ncbi:MAG: hypothetical protein ACR2IS_16650 [Nitrososphaeraceae archaeon]
MVDSSIDTLIERIENKLLNFTEDVKKKKLLVFATIVVVIRIIIYFTIISGSPCWQKKAITEWITAIGVPFAILFSSYTK